MDPDLNRLPNGSKVITRPPRLSQASVLGQYPSLHIAGKIANRLAKNESSLVFLMDGNLVNLVGVVALSAWQVLLMASYMGVPVVLLTMSFRAMPKYFPQLSGQGLFPNLNEQYHCKKKNYCNNHNARKNVAEIPPNAQKPVIRVRVLRQKKIKMSITQSILLRIAIISCFWNWKNHSTSTYELGLEISAPSQKIFTLQFPWPSLKF